MSLANDLRFNIKKLDWLTITVVALLVVLALPQMVRFYNDNSSLLGTEPYYHARLAERIAESGEINIFKLSSEELDLAYLKRPSAFNPYHLLLSGLSHFIDLDLASQIVPPILGVLTALFFFMLLGHFGFSSVERYVMLIFGILNPAFIYTFTISNPHSLAILLTIMGCYLFLQRSHIALWLALGVFALVCMFSMFNTLLVVVLLSALLLHGSVKKERFLFGILVLLCVSIFYPNRFYYEFLASQTNIIANIVSDLGGMLGFGVFTLILAASGLAYHWKRKSNYIVFAVAPIGIFFMVFIYGSSPVLYLSFFVTTLAGLGFLRLVDMRWKLRLVQSLTLLIVICGLLFSTVSYMNRIIDLEPDPSVEQSLNWLRDNKDDGIVLTHPDYGYWVERSARMPVLADPFSTSGYSQEFLYKTAKSIFYSRNLDDSKLLLDRFSIKYIWIHPNMKQGIVWDKENQGLLFLLSDSETFKNIYKREGIEIWEVLSSDLRE